MLFQRLTVFLIVFLPVFFPSISSCLHSLFPLEFLNFSTHRPFFPYLLPSTLLHFFCPSLIPSFLSSFLSPSSSSVSGAFFIHIYPKPKVGLQTFSKSTSSAFLPLLCLLKSAAFFLIAVQCNNWFVRHLLSVYTRADWPLLHLGNARWLGRYGSEKPV